MFFSIAALALSLSAVTVDATAIDCYSGTLCSKGAGSNNASIELVTKNSFMGICASMLFDCRSSTNPLCKTCLGGVFSQFSAPQTEEEIANLKTVVSSVYPLAQLQTCQTKYCNVPSSSNFIPITSKSPGRYTICYSGLNSNGVCVNSNQSYAILNTNFGGHASEPLIGEKSTTCGTLMYDCSGNLEAIQCKWCPGGKFMSHSYAGTGGLQRYAELIKSSKGSVRYTECSGTDYCNAPNFSPLADPTTPASNPAAPTATPSKYTGKSTPNSSGKLNAIFPATTALLIGAILAINFA